MRRTVLRVAAAAWFAAVAAAAGFGQETNPAASEARTIEVAGAPLTLTYRALQPGEVVWARLKPDAAVKRVVLALGDQMRALVPAGPDAPHAAEALLGIDLAARPQTLALKIEIERAGETAARVLVPLEIAPRTFPSVNLDVPPATVNPPKALLEQIRREAELVAEVLGRVAPDWLAEGPFQSPLPGFAPFLNFGQQRLYNKTSASVHSGLDIAAPRGTVAVASNAGRVVLANRLYYSGWTVILDHGRGVFTYCCHFDKVLVKRGDLVRKGQAVAEVGSTGRSTGPHLHWSVRVLSARVDPLSLVALPFD